MVSSDPPNREVRTLPSSQRRVSAPPAAGNATTSHIRNMRLFRLLAVPLAWAAPSAAFRPPPSLPAGILSRAPVDHASSTQLQALAPIDDVATLASSSSLQLASTELLSSALSSSIDVAEGILTTDNIKVAFSVATFFPQLPWLFLILLPNAGVTKKLLGGYEVVTLCCLVHFFIVTASIAQPDGTAPMAEFADVFDPSGDPQRAMVGMMQVRDALHAKYCPCNAMGHR